MAILNYLRKVTHPRVGVHSRSISGKHVLFPPLSYEDKSLKTVIMQTKKEFLTTVPISTMRKEYRQWRNETYSSPRSPTLLRGKNMASEWKIRSHRPGRKRVRLKTIRPMNERRKDIYDGPEQQHADRLLRLTLSIYQDKGSDASFNANRKLMLFLFLFLLPFSALLLYIFSDISFAHSTVQALRCLKGLQSHERKPCRKPKHVLELSVERKPHLSAITPLVLALLFQFLIYLCTWWN